MSTFDRSLVLADVVLPRAGRLESALLVALFAAATAGAAQLAVSLPWTPVPLTAQTLAVLLSGAALGARRGFAAQALYVALGACGAPVFAGGAGGAAWLVGPSGGYLLAFPFAALVTGALARRGWDRHPASMFAAMLAGSAVILALGAAQLARFVPASALAGAGVLPFVPGDVLKAALAAGASPLAWRFARGVEPR